MMVAERLHTERVSSRIGTTERNVKMKLVFLECGKLLAPHGIRGEMKMECYTDTPAEAAALPALFFENEDGSRFSKRLLSARPYRDGLLVLLEGISSPEEARLFSGRSVYARRTDLDPREEKVFYAELPGLPLIDAETRVEYGRVREVDLSRKTPLYLVDTPHGEVLFPAVNEFIKEIDVGRHILVCPIPGIFDEN